VALVRTDVSEDHISCIIIAKRFSELGITLDVTSNRSMLSSMLQLLVISDVVPSSPFLVTLIMEAICSSETSVLTRAKRRHIPEDGSRQPLFLLVYVCSPASP
jgi:hypothetical protein